MANTTRTITWTELEQTEECERARTQMERTVTGIEAEATVAEQMATLRTTCEEKIEQGETFETIVTHIDATATSYEKLADYYDAVDGFGAQE